MLLSHTSGITDNFTIPPTYDDLESKDQDSPISLRSYLEGYLIEGGIYYTANSWDNDPPGSAFNYCNTGVTLLAYLVEILTKTSFEDYCQENIFIPLGMNKASWFLANLERDEIAIPYVYSNGKYIPSLHWGHPTYPATQIRTSTLQVARFIMAFIQKGQVNGTRILESSTVDSMITVQYPDLSYWGLCWSVHEHNIPRVGTKIISAHSGTRRLGANTGMGFIVNEDIGAIILTNGDYGDAIPGIVEIVYELFSYGIITDIGNKNSVFPQNYILSQNYPNPFNPSTTIEFTLPKSDFVELKVYNILGKGVATLVSKNLNQGSHTYTYDGNNLASGIYYYQLQASNFIEVKKMLLLK
jgi:CubicO group peptidase (beta-lactamase class C family)